MEFDIAPYVEIRNALGLRGVKCGVDGRHQITVSIQDHAIWPHAGNSFWITRATGNWHLFTWAPVGYRVPDEVDMAELCLRCMAIGGNSAMSKMPDGIHAEFGLTELSDEDAEVVYTAMKMAR